MSEFEPLDLDDVICARFFDHPTFQAQEIIDFFREEVINQSTSKKALALGELKCLVLSSTNNRTGWVKGKLRLHLALEFCPDEPEVVPPLGNSELDEYRQ